MGGKSGGTTVIQPTTPASPTVGQSAAEYAAALPTILQAQLQYQPQFAASDFSDFQKYAPQYTAVYDAINKQYYPETYGLQETLAKQASDAATATDIPDWMKQQYRNEVNAQLGTNVNSPIGADYVSRGLIDQAQQYRQYYQNLGLSLAGRQPLTSTQYQQPSFSVANQFMPAYQADLSGYGSYVAANRPLLGQAGTPNWIPGLQAVGSVLQGIGTMQSAAANKAAAAGCWVASACFGGWYKEKTVFARYFINNLSPKWFKNLYIKYGELLSKNKIFIKIVYPIFEIFSYIGKVKLYGIR